MFVKRFALYICLLFASACSVAQSAKVLINGLEMEYEDSGGEGITLLLEAGGSAGMDDWQSIYPALAKQYRVIRYSRLGNCHSAPN